MYGPFIMQKKRKEGFRWLEESQSLRQLHMARPNGRFCGAKRPKCEAEQPLGFD